MRLSILLPLAALMAGVCAAPMASAQQVYKWKDAKGVTHYSQDPPPRGGYTTRDARLGPVAPAPAAATAAATSAPGTAAPVDTRCDTARRNLASLKGKAPVQMDGDGDGKPDRTLTDVERDNQAELARSTLKAYNCTETASAPAA